MSTMLMMLVLRWEELENELDELIHCRDHPSENVSMENCAVDDQFVASWNLSFQKAVDE